MSSHAAHTARIGGLLADPPAGPIARLLVILRSDPRAMTVAFLGTIVASLAALVQPALTGSLVGALQSLDMQRLMLIGSLLGGWLSGWIFDITGSYHAAFVNGIGWNLLNLSITGWLFLRVRRNTQN